MTELIWTTIAAFLTLAIFSFLYRDNPFYKFVEHIYVGSSAAFWVVYLWYFDVKPKLWEPIAPYFSKFGFFGMWSHFGINQWILLIPAFLSLLMLMRFIPPVSWLSRWAIAFTVGMGAGLGITGYLQGYLVPQVQATMLPLWVSAKGGFINSFWHSFNNWIIIVGTITSIMYFFFSREHRGFLGATARIGITFIMIAFGASFGFTVMARISLLIGRFYFLLHDWLHLI